VAQLGGDIDTWAEMQPALSEDLKSKNKPISETSTEAIQTAKGRGSTSSSPSADPQSVSATSTSAARHIASATSRASATAFAPASSTERSRRPTSCWQRKAARRRRTASRSTRCAAPTRRCAPSWASTRRSRRRRWATAIPA